MLAQALKYRLCYHLCVSNACCGSAFVSTVAAAAAVVVVLGNQESVP